MFWYHFDPVTSKVVWRPFESWRNNELNMIAILNFVETEMCFIFQTFNFDVEKLDWNTYFVRFVLGIKQFLLKEDLANLPVAQSRIRRLVCSLLVFSWFRFVNKLVAATVSELRYFGGQLVKKHKIGKMRKGRGGTGSRSRGL